MTDLKIKGITQNRASSNTQVPGYFSYEYIFLFGHSLTYVSAIM